MGMTVTVYRSPHGDFTNGGVSADVEQLTLVNVDGPFDPTPDRPAALLMRGNLHGTVKIVEAELTERGEWVESRKARSLCGPMFGGNYAATSDSRFNRTVEAVLGHRFYGAVAIHDRYETQEQYDLLSR